MSYPLSREETGDLRSSDIGRIIPVLQLRSQSLVERDGASFRAVIVDDRSHSHIRGHTGDGYYVSMVLLDHGR